MFWSLGDDNFMAFRCTTSKKSSPSNSRARLVLLLPAMTVLGMETSERVFWWRFFLIPNPCSSACSHGRTFVKFHAVFIGVSKLSFLTASIEDIHRDFRKRGCFYPGFGLLGINKVSKHVTTRKHEQWPKPCFFLPCIRDEKQPSFIYRDSNKQAELWFQTVFILIHTWWNDPISQIFFRWVGKQPPPRQAMFYGSRHEPIRISWVRWGKFERWESWSVQLKIDKAW